jgi:hypothetical protein
MPAVSAGIGVILDRYHDLIDRIDAAALAAASPGSPSPCGDCHSCCGPLSLLPLEAYVLLAAGLPDRRQSGADTCPLMDIGCCGTRNARPFACHARGLPVLHLDAEGDWTTAACGLFARGGLGQEPAVPLDEWAAQLFHLDREFRGLLGLRAGRIDLADLCRAPERYRALLCGPADRPIASRAAG